MHLIFKTDTSETLNLCYRLANLSCPLTLPLHPKV